MQQRITRGRDRFRAAGRVSEFLLTGDLSRPNAFPRSARLLQGSDFDAVFRRGRRSADQWFTILFCDNDAGHARLGMALAKKQLRLASQRNRVRRIVRETFRARQPRLPALDVVVMARADAAQATNEELFASLGHHWARIAGA